MRFLLDENTSKVVSRFLSQLGHTCFRIKEINPGIEDTKVLDLAVSLNAILITLDGDFGELIFKERQSHQGVIFLRLKDQTSDNIIKALKKVLKQKDSLEDHFTVITEQDNKFKIRVRSKN